MAIEWTVTRQECDCCLNRNYPTLRVRDHIGGGWSIICAHCFLHCRWTALVCHVPEEERDLEKKLRHAKFEMLVQERSA